MKEYFLLIILALGLSYWAAKSGAFSWATPAVIILGIVVALGGIIALIFKFVFTYLRFEFSINTPFAIATIVIFAYFLTAWLTETKTVVFVPKNYTNNYLIMIHEVKGAKKNWPSLTGFPRTYKLKFPQTGILTTSAKYLGNGYSFSMCEVLEENGSLFLPKKESRYFYSTSVIHNGFHIEILYLDETRPSNNNVSQDFLSQINFTKYEKIKEN
ncbi:MAG: hypothetical protein IPH94_15195 [Saprospiraceae bacterium]|nr:hypothetical protein [Saprospiraceae bacterium]MBK7789488.1 hypothetical protein [Saprospiraceae bacterium]MBK8852447.1 hypothetical protein [Saprospiraceae bacterium]MBK9689296.1 hypothetical protein [Saprospiraceae bacterium]